MRDSTILTVRVPKDLKESAKKLGIDISEVVRRALKEEIEKQTLKQIKEKKKKLKKGSRKNT